MEQKNNVDRGDWILMVIMLIVFWPVGLFLLVRLLTNNGKLKSSAKHHSNDANREGGSAQNGTRQTASSGDVKTAKSTASKKKKSRKTQSIPGETSGRVLTIVGISVSAVFALGLLGTLADSLTYGPFSAYVSDIFVLSGFLFGGLVCLGLGAKRRRQAKRFRSYLSYIGKNETVSLSALASAMGKRRKTVCRDLSNMLYLGVFPAGYIDMASDRLILTDEGIPHPVSQPAPEQEPVQKEPDENKLLLEIRAVNDAIPDRTMSEKIDRIGEITAKILDYQRSHPEKSNQLRSFLNYYLPTTLKVLRAYAQLDAQGIEGENITAAKQRIENMMDQVVYGFEKQLDRLFQDDTMDITSDVAVLENMLRQDGLSDPFAVPFSSSDDFSHVSQDPYTSSSASDDQSAAGTPLAF